MVESSSISITPAQHADAHVHGGSDPVVGDVRIDGCPIGMIVLWHGTLVNIPTGWTLCDGTLGTPDLRDRFVVGAAAAANPGATGGANSHTISVAELPAHSHLTASGGPAGSYADTTGNSSVQGTSLPTSSVGSGTPIDTRPAYYAVAYIMKV